MELRSKRSILIFIALSFVLLYFIVLIQSPEGNYFSSPLQQILEYDENSNQTSKAPPRAKNFKNFQSALSEFNWDNYAHIVKNLKDLSQVDAQSEILLHILTDFILLDPPVPINSSCSPPFLESYQEIICPNSSQLGNAFNGVKRTNVPKIGILVQFGFGVDVLEIYLNEVYDVVDKFFIIESTKSHFRTNSKALIWERVRDEERFRKFSDKIVHFVIDDAESADASQESQSLKKLDVGQKIWTMERKQEYMRWSKFMEWNNAFKVFGPDDILGFGDADEIPSRSMLNYLKICSTKTPVVDFGIWFPFGNIKYAFETDFPVKGHKYTLGDPTFWTLSSAVEYSRKKTGNYPSRNRGLSPSFILGGIHMTHYGYLPYQLIRRISCSECGPFSATTSKDLEKRIKNGNIREIEIEYGAIPEVHFKRIAEVKNISQEMENIAILPWFYDCNRDRYPVWEGKHDLRLD